MSGSRPLDLVIRAGRVVCPATGRRLEPGSIGVRCGRVAAVAERLDEVASRTLDFRDGTVLPGLVDLHAHPAKSGSVFGVDPDKWMLTRGVTTVLSQGDAGATNCDEYAAETISGSQTRVRLAINLSRIGESTAAGCLEQIDDANVGACVVAVERQRDSIWGIAVNASNHCCGAATDPREVLRRGLAVANQTGLPLLYGMRRPQDWPLAEQLALLRAGDVVTYCFRRQPHCIVENGGVLPEVRDARSRGVLFDVGHGMASFDFDVAETAIAAGFLPDTISTDLHRHHIDQRREHDLPLLMSKLRAAGMVERDVFTAVTSTPARVLQLDVEIGTLASGACADLVVLRTDSDREMVDANGNCRTGDIWRPVLTVRAGLVVGDDAT